MLARELRKILFHIIRIIQIKIPAAYSAVRKTDHEIHKFCSVLFEFHLRIHLPEIGAAHSGRGIPRQQALHGLYIRQIGRIGSFQQSAPN